MRRRTIVVLGSAIAMVVGGAIAGIVTQTGQRGAEAVGSLAVREGLTPKVSAHLARLSHALPGTEGMDEEGPAGAAEDEFMERAYPADTISVGEMDAARTAFTAAKTERSRRARAGRPAGSASGRARPSIRPPSS